MKKNVENIYIKDMAWCIGIPTSPLSLLDEFQPFNKNEMLNIKEYIEARFQLKNQIYNKDQIYDKEKSE